MTHSIDESPFAIRSHKEITFHLEDLAKHKTPVTLEADEGVVLVTSVLYVSGDGKYVCIDVGADEGVNARILHSHRVSFVSQSDIKVRWYSTHLQLVAMPNGKHAFSMHVPSSIERIQRREYFRLVTPQGKNVLRCRIPTENEIIEVPLFDMSVGGIGVTIKGELPAIFVQGEILEGCSIELPEVGRVPINLRVRGKWSTISTLSGEHFHRVGLEFESLSRGASNVIQRYMVQLEAEQISLA
ncbi:MAG: flagellar regulator YcgR PilZN domain-containing protein [Sideroxydans sp.]|jgi:c-di-GMP-binding flagellar brake protein YcgR